MIRYKPLVVTPETVTGAPAASILPDTIISWDGGNGMSSTWMARDGVLYQASLPNVRVPVTGYRMGKAVAALPTMEFAFADTVNGSYGIGDHIWGATTNAPQSFIGSAERYGSETHIFMLLCLLAILDAPQRVPLTIVTSAPPSMVDQVANRIKKSLKAGESGNGNGVWQIQMSWDREPRYFQIGKVIVIPEGYGSYAAYAYDTNGTPVTIPMTGTANALSGEVHVHDAGYGTYDAFRVVNGLLATEDIATSSDLSAGISAQILKPILNAVLDAFRAKKLKEPKLHHSEVDLWLRRWVSGGMNESSAMVKVAGRDENMQHVFETMCRRYAQFVLQEKIEASIAARADALCLAGGGWTYSLPFLQDSLKKYVVLTPAKVKHLKRIPVWELGPYGALVMSVMSTKQGA